MPKNHNVRPSFCWYTGKEREETVYGTEFCACNLLPMRGKQFRDGFGLLEVQRASRRANDGSCAHPGSSRLCAFSARAYADDRARSDGGSRAVYRRQRSGEARRACACPDPALDRTSCRLDIHDDRGSSATGGRAILCGLEFCRAGSASLCHVSGRGFPDRALAETAEFDGCQLPAQNLSQLWRYDGIQFRGRHRRRCASVWRIRRAIAGGISSEDYGCVCQN